MSPLMVASPSLRTPGAAAPIGQRHEPLVAQPSDPCRSSHDAVGLAAGQSFLEGSRDWRGYARAHPTAGGQSGPEGLRRPQIAERDRPQMGVVLFEDKRSAAFVQLLVISVQDDVTGVLE